MNPRRAIMGLTLASVLGACTSVAPAPTPTSPPLFGFAVTAEPGASPSTTPSPMWTPTATYPNRASPQPGCLNNASFLEDLTIPDGTLVLPGESLDKRWSVLNSGTCDWGPDYRLVQVGTSEMRGPDEIALYPAQAGATAVWQIALLAPMAPGEYLGRWQARAPDGTLFGEEVFVLIFVEEPEATATPSATPTP